MEKVIHVFTLLFFGFSHVTGKDSISETVQTEEKEAENDVTQGDNEVTQGDEGEQVEGKQQEEGEQQIPEEESSQDETINNEEGSSLTNSRKKKDVSAHARQLKGTT